MKRSQTPDILKRAEKRAKDIARCVSKAAYACLLKRVRIEVADGKTIQQPIPCSKEVRKKIIRIEKQLMKKLTKNRLKEAELLQSVHTRNAPRVVRLSVPLARAAGRAYRSPTRSTQNSAASHDDGGGGSESDQGDPPKRPYYPLTISNFKLNRFPLSVAHPRLLSHGRRTEAAL